MVTFADRHGRIIFWMDDENFRLITPDGNVYGYIREADVFDLRGNHRGWCLDGLLRDMDGNVVGFWSELRTAPNAPILPLLHYPLPMKPMIHIFPQIPVFGQTHVRSQLHMSWSELDPYEWLRV